MDEKKIPVQPGNPAQAGDDASVNIPSDALGVEVRQVQQRGTSIGSGNVNTTKGVPTPTM